MSSDAKVETSNIWTVEDDRRDVTIKYSTGTLSYKFRKITSSDKKYTLALDLRFANAFDRNVYVKTYNNWEITLIWGKVSVAESIYDSLTKPRFVIPLEKNCIIIPGNTGRAISINNNMEIIMNLDNDSQSDNALINRQLTVEIESLKHAHADEVAALRSEIAELTEPANKKSKYTASDIANAF